MSALIQLLTLALFLLGFSLMGTLARAESHNALPASQTVFEMAKGDAALIRYSRLECVNPKPNAQVTVPDRVLYEQDEKGAITLLLSSTHALSSVDMPFSKINVDKKIKEDEFDFSGTTQYDSDKIRLSPGAAVSTLNFASVPILQKALKEENLASFKSKAQHIPLLTSQQLHFKLRSDDDGMLYAQLTLNDVPDSFNLKPAKDDPSFSVIGYFACSPIED